MASASHESPRIVQRVRTRQGEPAGYHPNVGGRRFGRGWGRTPRYDFVACSGTDVWNKGSAESFCRFDQTSKFNPETGREWNKFHAGTDDLRDAKDEHLSRTTRGEGPDGTTDPEDDSDGKAAEPVKVRLNYQRKRVDPPAVSHHVEHGQPLTTRGARLLLGSAEAVPPLYYKYARDCAMTCGFDPDRIHLSVSTRTSGGPWVTPEDSHAPKHVTPATIGDLGTALRLRQHMKQTAPALPVSPQDEEQIDHENETLEERFARMQADDVKRKRVGIHDHAKGGLLKRRWDDPLPAHGKGGALIARGTARIIDVNDPCDLWESETQRVRLGWVLSRSKRYVSLRVPRGLCEVDNNGQHRLSLAYINQIPQLSAFVTELLISLDTKLPAQGRGRPSVYTRVSRAGGWTTEADWKQMRKYDPRLPKWKDLGIQPIRYDPKDALLRLFGSEWILMQRCVRDRCVTRNQGRRQLSERPVKRMDVESVTFLADLRGPSTFHSFIPC